VDADGLGTRGVGLDDMEALRRWGEVSHHLNHMTDYRVRFAMSFIKELVRIKVGVIECLD